MKTLNRRNILWFVGENRLVSRAEVGRHLHMSKATVSSLVGELLDEGMLVEAGKGDAKIGRRPILLDLNVNACVALVADLSGSRPLVALVNWAGQVVYRTMGKSLRKLDPQESLVEFLALMESVVFDVHLQKYNICGIGIAVPEIVDSSTGIIRSSAWLGWKGVNLVDSVFERTGLPTRVDNDVNAAAVGEIWKGAAREISNLVLLHAGDGIGAAIVINGRIYRGADNAAGEVGHFILGSITSGGSFAADKLESLVAAQSAAAEERGAGTELAGESEVGEAARWLLMTISNIVSCLNPELLLVKGELLEKDIFDVDEATAYVQRNSASECKVGWSALGADGVLIGAAADVFQSLELIRLES